MIEHDLSLCISSSFLVESRSFDSSSVHLRGATNEIAVLDLSSSSHIGRVLSSVLTLSSLHGAKGPLGASGLLLRLVSFWATLRATIASDPLLKTESRFA